jgi:alpha-beta hydrolase superfamily lysophospholipase
LPKPGTCETVLPRPVVLPLRFDDQTCLAIYQPAASELLVLLINGGAQIRAGSHRLYQQLALDWQQAGIASLRFDFPGFGDADGQPGDFVAHSRYLAQLPAQLENYFGRARPVACFGLCDGATAALLATPVLKPKALLLLNPWLRTPVGHASTMLKFYYLQQLKSRQFWRKVLSGKLNWRQSLLELTAFWRRRRADTSKSTETTPSAELKVNQPAQSMTAATVPQANANMNAYPAQTDSVKKALQHWNSFSGPCLLALAEPDLTAAECRQALSQKPWCGILQRAELLNLPEANHTLSRRADLQAFSAASQRFLLQLNQG